MPIAQVNGIALDYESHGAADAPAVLAIMGLGMPGAAWPPALIDRLVARGLRVVTFDNRDCGNSTKLTEAHTIALPLALFWAALRLRVPAPYTLHDLAADSIGLLDAIGLKRVHLVGVSMGGMVAQLIAARFPERTLSLTSIMSSTGNPHPHVAWGNPSAIRAILSRPEGAQDVNTMVDQLEHVYSIIGSPSLMQDREAMRTHLAQIAQRGIDSVAARRQLLAILATGDRRAWLEKITAPTLVIHGRIDPLVPVAAGIETAQCIAGAQLSIIDDMGHDLPLPLLPRLADEIATHVENAGGR